MRGSEGAGLVMLLMMYGTASLGGINGYGTVFSLSVGLGPFVEALPASGTAGAAVDILGPI
jgi:hypothetical protein